ncbi:MAG: hypothetical protein PVJ86_12890 [Phycisphaerales bacterium]|jgi:hypothetical protein
MNVKFLKYCPWSYGGGRVRKYQAGTVHDIKDGDASEMIRCGYAEEFSEETPKTNESDSEEKFDFEERRRFYRRFSRSELIGVCRENIKEYMPSVHKNIPDLIDLILVYEENHGILKEKEDE